MEAKYGGRVDRERDYKQLILDSVDASLKRLGTDHLDIVMCPHGASTPYELTRYPETVEAFEILRRAGKVRHLGVSAHNDPAGVLEAALEVGAYSVAMVAYNLVNARYLDEALARAHSRGLGVIAMKVARPFYPGRGRGEASPERLRLLAEAVAGDWTVPQKAYLWALRNPHLAAVNANMVDAEQVEQDLKLLQAVERG
jgi:aryl-alcohol dehydrogenase-like predicted oxidoreductase